VKVSSIAKQMLLPLIYPIDRTIKHHMSWESNINPDRWEIKHKFQGNVLTTNHYTRNVNKQLFRLYMNTERGDNELHKSYQIRPYSALTMEIGDREIAYHLLWR
jgi:hypothetical protein